jgi:F420H(2)-dependent quinone reductase
VNRLVTTTSTTSCPPVSPPIVPVRRVHRAAIVAAVGGRPTCPTRAGAPVVLGDVARRMPRLIGRLTVVHAALFLLTRGRVLSRWFGSPILVLETVGRRTGTRRLTPLVYLPHRDDFAVIPANAGAHRPPAWWLNLQAAGEGFAVLNGQRHHITPTIATGIEHDRLWRQFRVVAPTEHYQRRARRALPIVVLTRAGAPPPSAAAGPLSTTRPAFDRTSKGDKPT